MESLRGNDRSSTAAAPVIQLPTPGATLAAKNLELSVTTPINTLRSKLAEQLLNETKLLSNSTAPISERSKVMAKLGEVEEMLEPLFEGLDDWAKQFTKVVAERKAL